MAQGKSADLVLGWKLNKGMDPEYWLQSKPKFGNPPREQLIRVAAPNIAHHTIIIAQSGFGKSFFLGRYLEEILLKTKARMLVLDSNGDFKQVSKVVSQEEWDNVNRPEFAGGSNS